MKKSRAVYIKGGNDRYKYLYKLENGKRAYILLY